MPSVVQGLDALFAVLCWCQLLPCSPCHINNDTPAQKGKDKKKAKYDSLQELRKNKKELEFEQKLYKEKEEMLEKEKQLKINRLAQEVRVLLVGQASISGTVWLSPALCCHGASCTCAPQMDFKDESLLSPQPGERDHPTFPTLSDTNSWYGFEANLSAQIIGLRLVI